MGMYPHTTLQYQMQSKAKHGIVRLIVDNFPYLWK